MDRECLAAHLAVLYERYLYHVRRVQAAQPGPGVLCGGDGEDWVVSKTVAASTQLLTAQWSRIDPGDHVTSQLSRRGGRGGRMGIGDNRITAQQYCSETGSCLGLCHHFSIVNT